MLRVELTAGVNQEVENGEKLYWEGMAKCSVLIFCLFLKTFWKAYS